MIRKLIEENKMIISKIGILSIIVVIVQILASIIYRDFVDNLEKSLFDQAMIALISILLVQLAIGIAKYFNSIFSLKLDTSISYQLTKNIMSRLMYQSTKSFSKNPLSHYEAIMIYHIRKIRNLFSQCQDVFTSPLLFLGALLFGIIINPFLVLVTMLVLLANIMINHKVQNSTEQIYKTHIDDKTSLFHLIDDSIQGHEEIQIFEYNKTIVKRFINGLDKIFSSGKNIVKKETNSSTMKTSVRVLSSLVICFFAGYLTYMEYITLGEFTAYLSLISYYFIPVENLFNFILIYKDARSVIPNLQSVLDTPKEERTVLVKNQNSRYALESKNLEISFDGKIILNKANIKIRRGESIAIFGASGSGKSSLHKAFLNENKIEKGNIEIMGEELYNNDSYDLSNVITSIDQQQIIFNTSILENIRLFNQDISLDMVKKACEIVEIDSFIENLEKKYYTNFEQDNLPLSGGQIRRIFLARGLIRNTEILLLDEPTSDVDESLAHKIMQRIVSLPGKTIVYNTHDSALAKYATKVYYIEDKILKEVKAL